MMTESEMPLWQLNVAEFKAIIADVVEQKLRRASEQAEDAIAREKRYVHGIKGLQEIFSCSISKANSIKQSGIIDGAISQTGRKFVVDVDEALRLVREHSCKPKR